MTSIVSGDISNPIGGLPVWARVAAYLGVPAAVAGVLLFFVTNVMASRLDKIEETLQAQTKSDSEHAANDAIAIEQNWQIVGTLQQVCLNVSKTNQERLACVSQRRPQ